MKLNVSLEAITSNLTLNKIISHLNRKIKVQGRIKSIRNHGFKQFIDLRYSTEEIQITAKNQDHLIKGCIIVVEGTVVEREPGNVNPNKTLGAYEIQNAVITVLSTPTKHLPFDYEDANVIQNLSDDANHKNRQLYLRSTKMQTNLRLRDQLISYLNSYMHTYGFIRVETPIITAGTPEGARDFLIPSRLQPGKFYALPQSPQQFKQTLMSAGIERYYSIAPCFRDEDGRKDRCFGEFYQLDFECSFASAEHIIKFLCNLMINCINHFVQNARISLHTITYDQSLQLFASDKPDLRITNQVIQAPSYISKLAIFSECNNIKAIKATMLLKEVEQIYKLRTQFDLLFEYVYCDTQSVLHGKLAKFITKHDLHAQEVIFFAGNNNMQKLLQTMSFIRNQLVKTLPHLVDFALVVVNEFPMYEPDEEHGVAFAHNPFSQAKLDNVPMPVLDDILNNESLLIKGNTFNSTTSKPEGIFGIRALQYDIALNGYEIASGSQRNTDIQALIENFERCGYQKNTILSEFNMIFESFAYGVPPHAGAAVGIERLLMILLSEENIRSVVAFPLSSSGNDPLTNTPKQLTDNQLALYGLRLIHPISNVEHKSN
jgi:aspartyl-tRNA synthetase